MTAPMYPPPSPPLPGEPTVDLLEPPRRRDWTVVGLVSTLILAIVVLVLGTVAFTQHSQADARLRHVGSLSSDLASTQSSLDAARSDLSTAQAQVSSLQSRLSSAQSSSAQARAVGAQFDQCVQDVTSFLVRLQSVLGSFVADPTLEAYGTQVGTECRQARDAFASLVGS